MRGRLIGYDRHIIYRVVYIESQSKVIKVKDLHVFEDNEAKTSTDLLDYEDAPTFQGFFLVDDNEVRNPKN